MSYSKHVESVLHYGLVMWENSTEVDAAFVLQKKCIRAICGLKRDESWQIYQTCMFVSKNLHLFITANDINPHYPRDPHRLELNDIPGSTKYNKNCLAMCVRV